MTNPFFATMVLDPFVVYIVGMSLVIGLAGIFLLSLRYYIKAKDLAPYLHKIEELVAKLSELQEKIENAEKELKDKVAEITKAERLIQQGKDAEEWLKNAKDEIETTQKNLESVRAAIETEKVHKEDLDRQISERQQILVGVETKVVDAETRIKEAEKEVESIRKENAELSVEVPKLRTERDSLKQEIAGQKAQIADLEKCILELRTSIDKINGELERLNGVIAARRELKTELEAKLAKLQEEISAANKRKIKLSGELFADETRKAEIEEERKRIAAIAKNMWNDLERPVAAIIGCSGHRWTERDESFAIENFASNLEAAHYKFHPRTIKAFHTGLLCGDISPMLVLAGISGTGKSLLPELYASQFNMNFLPVAVQPRWDGPQDMFGFYNHMEGRYKATELSRLLYQFDRFNNDLAKKAYAQDSALPMSIVLLDEMNLARIEYYFSELLSKLEIRRNVINPTNAADRFKSEIELEYGASSESETAGDKKTDEVKRGKRIYVGRNILFVGTMNEDESTQTLSGKVIDRSNVLRFGIPGQLLQTPNREIFDSSEKKTVTFDTWMRWATSKGKLPININLDEIVKKVNGALDLVDRGFGHRTETAIKTYVNLYPGSKVDAIADQIEMKILPRLNGTDKDLVKRDVAHVINDILASMRAEDVQNAFDAVLRDDKSAFFSWKGVNR